VTIESGQNYDLSPLIERVKYALKKVKASTLCIGIKSDILYPITEQKFIAENVEKGTYSEIDSFFGHDGFLIEAGQVSDVIIKFWEETSLK